MQYRKSGEVHGMTGVSSVRFLVPWKWGLPRMGQGKDEHNMRSAAHP